MTALDLNARINLRGAHVLVFDTNPQALDAIRQMLAGFGVGASYACDSAEAARERFGMITLGLIIVDPLAAGGFDFIRWLRREETSPNHVTPVIAALGHQTIGNVRAARDAGANFVLAKPLSPEVLLQRIEWVARENRQFVIAPNYAGPDRRFRNDGPPPGMDGRRADDLSFEVPLAASEPNMSQFEVDVLMKPQKVVL
jgi:DNA-binding response OmpR family regulator